MWQGAKASVRIFFLARKSGINTLRPIQQDIFKSLVVDQPKQPTYKRDVLACRTYANKLLVESGFKPFYDIKINDSLDDNDNNNNGESITDIEAITDIESVGKNEIGNADIKNVSKNLGVIGMPGTGKTIGFLIALSEIINREREIHKIDKTSIRPKIFLGTDNRQETRFRKLMASRTSRISKNNILLAPHTLIICPSRETCLSIYKQTLNFELPSLILAGGYGYKRRSCGIGLINNINKRRKGWVTLGENADVVIGTPEMIVRLLLDKISKYEIDLDGIKSILLCESHILLDGKDLLKINQIFDMFKNYFIHFPAVYISCVAKTSAVIDFSQKNLQQIHWIVDQSRITYKQSFIALSGQDRVSRLLQQQLVGKIIVFCNTVKSSQFVYNVLCERGIKTYLLHGEKSYRERTRELYKFNMATGGVLVSTDVFSRGYKLGRVDGFISFDFPRNIADYLSRLSVVVESKGWIKTFFAKKHKELIRQIIDISDGDLIEFQNSGPIYPIASNKPKYSRTIKTVNRHITSVYKKMLLKKMYYKDKIMKNVEFLRRRKLLGKKQFMPRMPDQTVEQFDTQEIIRMQRSKDGFVQIFPKRRSNLYIRRKQNKL